MHQHRFVYITLGMIIAVVSVMFITTGMIYYSTMNKHINTFENARGIADFSCYERLEREEACFISNQGNQLQGYFYHSKDVKNNQSVIIVNNGFGAGHEAMLGEIQALAEKGYLVYGFDKTGYDSSEGKGIGSLTQGIYDLENAIEYVSHSEQAADKDIILYGKSWGAYCSLAVLNKTDQISAVVSMSAFNKTSDMMKSEVKRMLGGIGEIFTPFCYIFDWINEDHITALSGIENTNARVLIMHSVDDETVDVKQSYDLFLKKCGNQKNIEFEQYTNKNHSIIKSDESMQYNQQMDRDLEVFAEAHGGEMTDELWKEFLSQYDLTKCSEPDAAVIERIVEFLEE